MTVDPQVDPQVDLQVDPLVDPQAEKRAQDFEVEHVATVDKHSDCHLPSTSQCPHYSY